uniref:Transposase Tc1-like domain-containing protein n=1 Tax=Gadus morhua TaxID=8049 RepID=A0A8C5A5A7_GADMO
TPPLPCAANQVPDWHLIGQLQAGVPQNQVAALFGVSPSTPPKPKAHIMGDVKDRTRSGRPKKTTTQEDRFITLSALRRYGRRLSAQTIRNRLHAADLRSHRAARSPATTALHRQARLHWCHVHWNLNMWGNIMFSDESRFCLRPVAILALWGLQANSNLGAPASTCIYPAWSIVPYVA